MFDKKFLKGTLLAVCGMFIIGTSGATANANAIDGNLITQEVETVNMNESFGRGYCGEWQENCRQGYERGYYDDCRRGGYCDRDYDDYYHRRHHNRHHRDYRD